MATSLLVDVEFRIVKTANPGPYAYVRAPRRASIFAASIHPKDILTVLNADIPLNAGESIEILNARPGAVGGTEGNQVLS